MSVWDVESGGKLTRTQHNIYLNMYTFHPNFDIIEFSARSNCYYTHKCTKYCIQTMTQMRSDGADGVWGVVAAGRNIWVLDVPE